MQNTEQWAQQTEHRIEQLWQASWQAAAALELSALELTLKGFKKFENIWRSEQKVIVGAS